MGAAVAQMAPEVRPGDGEEATSDSNLEESTSDSDLPATSIDSSDAEMLTELVPASPEILRATRAAVPLECFGAVLRHGINSAVARGESRDRYSRSRRTTHFDEFWSHSWHGPVWQKVLALLLFYNSPAAVALSLVAASAGAGLQLWGPCGSEEMAGLMAFCPAFLTFFLTLGLWRSRRRVFLDSVCICQADAELKQQGIMSLGGFLRHSSSMLILWDPTYCSRLWCMFEQAAFYSLLAKDLSRRVYVRPTFQVSAWLLVMPLVSLATLAALCLNWLCGWDMWQAYSLSYSVLFLVMARPLRMIVQDLDGLPKQIESFTMERMQCFCCSHGHHHPTTHEELACDRLVVEASVRQWFGSIENFESFVRTETKERFRVQCDTPPYRIAVLWSLPRLWWTLGKGVHFLSMGNVPMAVEEVVENAYGCLFYFPLVAEFFFCFAWLLRTPSSSWVLDVGKDITLCLVLSFLSSWIWFLFYIVRSPVQMWNLVVALGVASATCTALVYRQRIFY